MYIFEQHDSKSGKITKFSPGTVKIKTNNLFAFISHHYCVHILGIHRAKGFLTLLHSGSLVL